MKLHARIERLKRAAGKVVTSLTEEERARLESLNDMEEDDPNYDLLEHIELYLRTKPRKTFEELLEELED